MNYLAHAYLSFNDPGILSGNLISDFVKGKKQYDYDLPVYKGIQLHRAIDSFTDTHPAIKEMKKYFIPGYRLYAGPLTDIVCDYFLANDKREFTSATELKGFTADTYITLEKQFAIFPPSFQSFFLYMKEKDMLAEYQYESGIYRSFNGMSHHAKYIGEIDTAFEIFKKHIPDMKPCYEDFFPSLKSYAAHMFHELINNG